MDGLSFSSWIILILGFVICFGGAFYCLLIVIGKQPERIFEMLGIDHLVDSSSDAWVNAGIYKPFEYMEKGPKEQGVVMGVVLILLVIGWGLGVFESEEGTGEYELDYEVGLKDGFLDPPISGTSDEDSQETEYVTIDEPAVTNITFTLTWEDEPDQPGMENEGDEFSMEVTTPWGDNNETPMTRNDHGEEGIISLTFSAPGEYPDSGSAGEYIVNITMGEAGEQWLLGIPSVGLTDSGNDWTLSVEYSYWKKVV